MDPVTISAILSALTAGASALGGGFGRKQETPREVQKRELIDELLSGVKGQGSFKDLFSADESAFQKSFVDPSKSRFSNQIAPQIQQGFIESGQQRGTGLEDTLTRAGVDLDQMLNEHYMNFQQGVQNRQLGGINAFLGQPDTTGQTFGQGAMQGLLGYTSGGGASGSIDNILRAQKNRRGFEKPTTIPETVKV